MSDVKDLRPVPEVSEADQGRARRYVASSAKDADDAKLLLQMLGLIETPPSRCSSPSVNNYNKGRCSCDGCRAAAVERQTEGRRSGRYYQGEPKVHGTWSTYCNYRCRCAPCKAAASARRRQYAERKKAG